MQSRATSMWQGQVQTCLYGLLKNKIQPSTFQRALVALFNNLCKLGNISSSRQKGALRDCTKWKRLWAEGRRNK